jgi:hypothetical protein
VVEQNLDQGGFLEGEGGDPGNVGFELFKRWRLSLSHLDGRNPLVHLLEEGVQEAIEDIPLIFEIEIEGPSGDAGPLDDIGNARSMEALLGKDGFGCIEDLLAPLLSYHPPSSPRPSVSLRDGFSFPVWRLDVPILTPKGPVRQNQIDGP